MGIFEVADEKLMLILKGMISKDKDKDNNQLIKLKNMIKIKKVQVNIDFLVRCYGLDSILYD